MNDSLRKSEIHRILDKLLVYWTAHPEERLGNLIDESSVHSELYFLSDAEFEKRLDYAILKGIDFYHVPIEIGEEDRNIS